MEIASRRRRFKKTPWGGDGPNESGRARQRRLIFAVITPILPLRQAFEDGPRSGDAAFDGTAVNDALT